MGVIGEKRCLWRQRWKRRRSKKKWEYDNDDDAEEIICGRKTKQADLVAIIMSYISSNKMEKNFGKMAKDTRLGAL